MEATSRGIVQEVLTKDNYERWKTIIKNYLLGKKLWAVVENDSVSTEVGARERRTWRTWRRTWRTRKTDWGRMDAEALHIIQLSCESKIFNQIRRCETAKDAWNFLGSRYGSELKAGPDMEEGLVDYYPRNYIDLYMNVEKGNLKGAESFIKGNPDALFSDSALGRTVLHVATMAGHVNIVDALVKIGSDRLVKMQDKEDYTALAFAANLGYIDVAKRMVEDKGRVGLELLGMKNKAGEIPVLLAAGKGHKEMTRYLYDRTPENLLDGHDSHNRLYRVLLLERCIKRQIFDVALELLLQPDGVSLCTSLSDDGFPALRELANMPSAFLSGCQFGLIQQFIYDILRVEKKFQKRCGNFCTGTVTSKGRGGVSFSYGSDVAGRFCKSVLNFLLLRVKYLGIWEIYELKCIHYQVQQILSCLQRSVEKFDNLQLDKGSVYDAMLDAAKHGIVEFINAMTEANPKLLLAMDSLQRGIFSYAVLHRKQNVFQLICSLNGRKGINKYRKDVFNNNLLHLAGQLGPSSYLNCRPGAALQMQREIQWFKAVEKVVHPKCKEEKNDDDKKPHELFTEEHEELVKAGQKWAKETARSFTLVGTLITTIMFAAAFTIPGGNNQETGVPIFLNNKVFTAFVVADAISLFTSATSSLIFIAILTSSFAENDFLKRLPWKLLLGLVFLFLSVVSMMVAFCAALAIVLKSYWAYRRLIIGATIFGSVPVMVLVLSQLSFILEIFRSTISNPIGYIKEKNQ